MNSHEIKTFSSWPWRKNNFWDAYSLISGRVVDKLDNTLEKKYWAVHELEQLWVTESQEKWDIFKKSQIYLKYGIPDLVKWFLLSKWIIP